MSPNEIRALVSLPAKAEGQGLMTPAGTPSDVVGPNPQPDEQPQTPAMMGNDNIKKLSGREYQNLMRIVRHYAQEKITLEMANQRVIEGTYRDMTAEAGDAPTSAGSLTSRLEGRRADRTL